MGSAVDGHASEDPVGRVGRGRRPHRLAAGLVALATLAGVALVSCGGKSANSGSKGTQPKLNVTDTNSTSVGNDGKTPVRGGALRYALGAETPGGYCLPEAQLA